MMDGGSFTMPLIDGRRRVCTSSCRISSETHSPRFLLLSLARKLAWAEVELPHLRLPNNAGS
jgi:hypothetical protein